MSRIKLQLPEQFPFSVNIPIRITDLNYGGHVGNDTILTLIHEARMQYLKSFKYTELELEGASLIMSDAGIEFKAELFYGDTITIFVAATNFSKVSFDLYYKVVKDAENTVVALAKTGMVCYDYTYKKVVAVPQILREKLSGIQ